MLPLHQAAFHLLVDSVSPQAREPYSSVAQTDILPIKLKPTYYFRHQSQTRTENITFKV